MTRKKKIIFIMNDRGTGGFTSALSSLYSVLKVDYEVNVLELSTYGNAQVSYDKVCISPSFLCNGYFSDYTLSKGYAKFRALIARVWAKIFGKPLERLVDSYSVFFCKADCIIAYSEGKATQFARNIKHNNKIAWIHYNIAHYPYDSYNNELFSSFRKIICVANVIANSMKELYPSLADKIDGIHNVIDIDRINKLSKSPITEDFEDCINIISLGRIIPLKRFSSIPMIANALKEKGVSFRWRILGPAHDEKEKDEMLNAIRKHHLEEKVMWLGPKDNPYPYIAKSDILVCLSETEACPMIFTEARILDTLIITTDFPSSFEFVENDIDGVITSFDSLSERLLQVCNNKTYYEDLLKNSRNRGDGTDEIRNQISKIVM